jgi:hypothetical protein
MRAKWLFGLTLFVLCLLQAPNAAAGCWECVNDICASADPGHAGKSSCITSCTEQCACFNPAGSTDCKGAPLQDGMLMTPNGRPFDGWRSAARLARGFATLRRLEPPCQRAGRDAA